VTALWSRVRACVRRWRRPASWDRALHDEMRAYLDHEIDDRIRSGMSPAEARRTALAEFGGIAPVKEQVRAGATGAWFDALGRDVRYGCRALMHSRGFAIWVVGSLAIGMAVTIAALALLNAILVLPFPGVTDQNRLVRVAVSRSCERPDCWTRMSSPADYLALRDGLTGLRGLAAHTPGDFAVALPEARSLRGALTSANYFDLLGVRAAVGRTFNPIDEETHAAVAVIAHSTWAREFDADPAVIGRSIRVADQFVQIVGVAPPLFMGTDRVTPGREPELWLPIWLADRTLPLTAAEQRRQERDVYFVGRLRDGVEMSQLQVETEVMAKRLASSRSQASQAGLGEVRRVWRVQPRSWQFGVLLVMPIPILVLVIACVNAANLMLARGSQRQREIAIRLAIGAGRGRIVRQLLIESAVLSLCATALAVPIAWWGLQLASSPWNMPIPFDPTVLVLTLLTGAGTTLAFGLAPALRVSAQQPAITLGPVGARSDAAPRQSRMRRALVIAQVALSLGLLATAWQLVGTVRAQAVSGGTPANHLLLARFDLQPFKLSPGENENFFRTLLDGTLRLPGVEAVGLARHTSVWTFGLSAGSASMVVWRPADAPDDGHLTSGGYAGGDLFEAVGLRIIAGRGFTEADRQLRPHVAIVNEPAARMLNGPAVGSILRVAPRGKDFNSSIDVRVVGVIEAAVEPRLEQNEPPAAKIYLPSPLESEPVLTLYVRTTGTATTLAQPVRELVSRIDQRVPLLEIGSLQEVNERSYATQLWLARGAGLLGIIGLLLATAGLYGVSSYVVAMRSREIAIRMAIGARPGVILAMVLGQSLRVAFIGLLVGGTSAVVVSRLIQSEYHGIQGIDGAAFAGAAAVFLAAMLLASGIPAVRASRLNPVENLKDA
jgi:putative ABC transport system permease protein